MKAYYKMESDKHVGELHQCSRDLLNFRVSSCQTPSASHSRQMVFSCFQASLSSGSPAVEAAGSLYPCGFCHGGAPCRKMTLRKCGISEEHVQTCVRPHGIKTRSELELCRCSISDGRSDPFPKSSASRPHSGTRFPTAGTEY